MKSRRKTLTIIGMCISALLLIFTYAIILTEDSSENALITDNKIQYKETDTGIYIGKIINERINGDGTVHYFIGDTYSGQFVNGEKNGNGTYTYADGARYKGNYKDGKREGKGSFNFKDGSIYDGQWIDDCMEGDGQYTFSNGDILTGSFKRNSFIKGTYEYTNDNGNFVIHLKGKKTTGEVEAYLNSGDAYIGKLVKNKFNGKCTITYDNGDTYKGGISANLKDGKGTYKWKKDGDFYVGQWKKDKMSGRGEYHFTSSKFPYLKGSFKSNKPAGSCIYYKSEKVKYITYWEKGSCTKVSK